MKIYISADIEGITGITNWDEANKKHADYQEFREQMTAEVVAACKGALNAGATEILIKDAHASGRNIILSQLPEEAKIIRGWSQAPLCMVQELDDSFDAVMFIGYHSRAGASGNPLAHTLTGKPARIKINDRYASEFLVHGYAAAMLKVPVVYVSGDTGLCAEIAEVNANISTLAVNQGIGASVLSMNQKLAVKEIRDGVKQALEGNLASCLLDLPESFQLEVQYKQHMDAYRAGFYPGAERVSETDVVLQVDDYLAVLTALAFIV